MTQTAGRFGVAAVVRNDSTFVESPAGFFLPRKFAVYLEAPGFELGLDIYVDDQANAHLRRVDLRSTAGDDVTRAVVRNLPLGDLLRTAVAQGAHERIEDETGAVIFRPSGIKPTSVVARGRRRDVSDELLRRVAEHYRRAVELRQPVIAEIANAENVAEATAARYIKRAREAGYDLPARGAPSAPQRRRQIDPLLADVTRQARRSSRGRKGGSGR